MCDPDRFATKKVLLTLLFLLLCADRALAYAGPGPALELVGYFFSLLAFAGTAFVAIFLHPIYALIRRLRGSPAPHASTTEPSSSETPAPVAQAGNPVMSETMESVSPS